MPAAAEPTSERARAKLNLDLLVTGRRSDGRHELDSLVVFCELADLLEFVPAPELSLTVEGPWAAATPADRTNLVVRAATLLARARARGGGAAIRLVKNLPVAAGLGGGSADAAAALRGLRRLWGLSIDDEALRDLGLELGADVPVCLFGRPARMRGIGERLDPVRGLPDLPLVLVNPGRPLATGAVFGRLRGPFEPLARPPLKGVDSPRGLADWLAQSRNDLEPAAIELEPAVETVLAELRALSGCLLARMSGSGATCFGLFSDRGEAETAAALLRRRRPDWWVAATTAPGDPR
ncbi:MAG: 4-(cytidine 5'-diphospho)-2-C-methyl-D-erythritol kinase [Geminicoccaceae bacterium]|nr:4-(cytidine 5'-diphospho)-2-C-methyl-D-erythritol kinase [Geminicoccaceae bacterium]MCX7628822.1 4-(cytidine 5'-diphospho)-2-C-methyl-D-erythritol kinase [Geminicoccaceae bacterium]MDW8340614.1 4-(cytidine 5'-diphospho)-2-C-methyl-D-erythritol kinase [Geminicoccaceae bacterium]